MSVTTSSADQSVDSFADDALGRHDAVGLLEAIENRELHPDEIRDAALARARATHSELNAVVDWVPEPVGNDGPLAGIPIFLKDNEDLTGLPTRHGSAATSARSAATTSPFAEALQNVGFTILGKSSLPEFGLTATTEPLATGPTRNPRNTDYSAGGSSGGSAALVAAGVVPVAHANDGGGSIRIPAACCGLVGLKPSRGRLIAPIEMDRLPVSIVAQGVVTRSVRDTALFIHQIEHAPSARTLAPIGHIQAPNKQRLRIAVVTDGMAGIGVDPDVRRSVLETASTCEELGHEVEVVPFPFSEQFGRDFLRYWAALAFSIDRGGRLLFGDDFGSDELEPFTKGLAGLFGQVALKTPGTIRRLRSFEQRYAQTYRGYDAILSPVLATPPPRIGYLSPGIDAHTHLVRLLRYASFTAIHNVAGAPAISLPLGVSSDGLPIGVQIGAHIGDEATLLSLAYELEEAVGWR